MIALVLGAGILAMFFPVRRACAFLSYIILDPSNLAEHVLQVGELAKQIAAGIQQVENQLKELMHLNPDVAPSVSATVAGIAGQLDAGLYGTPSPGSQLDTRYPSDMSSATWAQYQSDESTWTNNRRQSLAENRQVQNQVYRDLDTTMSQVRRIVKSSNSAPGETAAIQAHNDLLAVASAEAAKLQALQLARSRLKTEQLAQEQSELSYAQAERARVRSGWDNPAPPTEAVVDPFQD